YLGTGEKGGCSAHQVGAQMKAWNVKAMIRQPSQEEPGEKKEDEAHRGKKEVQERATLEDETPVQIFLPTGKETIQERAQVKALKRQSGEPDMGKLLIRIFRQVMWNIRRGLTEDFGILHVLTSQQAAAEVPHDDTVAGINDDPAAVHA